MRTLLMAILATAAFTGSTFAADKEVPAKAENKVCACGAAVDGKTTATVGDKTYNVCGIACADKLKGAKAEDADKKFQEANKPKAP